MTPERVLAALEKKARAERKAKEAVGV